MKNDRGPAGRHLMTDAQTHLDHLCDALEDSDFDAIHQALDCNCEVWAGRQVLATTAIATLSILRQVRASSGVFFAVGATVQESDCDVTRADFCLVTPGSSIEGGLRISWHDQKIKRLEYQRNRVSSHASVQASCERTDITNILHQSDLLYRTDLNLVGWGTGDYFKRENGPYRHRLTALIDSDCSRQGKTIDGLPVYGPDYLKSADPAKTAVMVFSSFFREIETQLMEMGIQNILCPLSAGQQKSAAGFLVQAHVGAPVAERSGHPKTAIVVQGPVDPNLTLPLVRRFRLMEPESVIIVSTWENTANKHIDVLRQHADEVLLLPDVDNPGDRNRNRQSYSTAKGVEAARSHGCARVLKVRSDIWLTRKDVLAFLENMWAGFPTDCRGTANGRLIVPQSFSRVFMPFHPSDMVMYGEIGDMSRFWCASHESSQMPNSEPDTSLWRYCLSGGAPESDYGYRYCKNTGGLPAADFEGSLTWFANHFCVVDDEDLGLFWYKLRLDQKTATPAKLYSHAIWRALAVDSKHHILAALLDPDQLSLGEFRESLKFSNLPRQDEVNDALGFEKAS